jgi:hypothetical protein
MKRSAIVLTLALLAAAPAFADVSVGIDLPGKPDLVAVPGYAVDYAPQVNANYFFSKDLYWVFEADAWYSSSGYNGPWRVVDPAAVPEDLTQLPLLYFHQPPAYFGYSHGAERWRDHREYGAEPRR